MKRLNGIFMVSFMIMISLLTGCGTKGGISKITVNEAAHSVFYAPLYVAIEKGYFKEEGLMINLTTDSGTDDATTALLKGKCDIGLLGTEASIKVYNEGTEDYVINFAQMTQRAGDFLVSRVNNESFDWKNLKGKTVIGSRVGSMPQMVFEYILKKQGMDPKTDLSIICDINSELAPQTFASGEGDYAILYEPDATALELGGKGKIVASLGMYSGRIPYTAFAAKKSYLEKHPEIIQSFTNAIRKGLDYVVTHTPEETAKTIIEQFPDTDGDALALILTGYYEQDTWKGNLIFEEGSFALLMDMMEDSGELLKKVPYEAIVNAEFAQKTMDAGK